MQTILNILPAHALLKVLFAAFVTIVFLQSGLDKALNYKGNLDYFKDQFKNSPLSPFTALLLPVITIIEIAAGILSGVGIIFIFLGNFNIAFYGVLLAAIDLLSLLFGQRMAKDYVGAAGIVPYFIAVMLGLVVFMM